mgnify:CR=1 FL=1|tara:strand:+ start:507 stop:719 length:213 start_codon:yes stop_codon:yes gene_type:complete
MTEKAIEESKPTTRTTRFAEWLMRREEARAERESNLEGLVKLNVMVSFLTLAMVGGFEAVRTAFTLIPYL